MQRRQSELSSEFISSVTGGWHECYYGIQENSTSSLDSVELCTGGEGLCVRVTNERDNYEYRWGT